MKRLIVGLTGSSGVIFGVRLLEVLKPIPNIETHLILSKGAELTLRLETEKIPADVKALADVVHNPRNLAASISSGSFPVFGMAVIPCSMKSLAQIALSLGDNLLARAADVTLKERRKLVLVPRETPLHLGHLRHMTAITEMGGVILPPMPAFYHAPKTIMDLVDQTVGKVLDQFEIEHDLFRRWGFDQPGVIC
jgi:flavin prenyltransferase